MFFIRKKEKRKNEIGVGAFVSDERTHALFNKE